jgi:hypothetical protein
MCHDILRIVYANDCTSGVWLAGKRRLRRLVLVSIKVGAG